MAKQESIILKLTQAVAVDGMVQLPGTLLEVTEQEAKNLLSRGKAELVEDPEPEPDPAKVEDAEPEPPADDKPAAGRKGK